VSIGADLDLPVVLQRIVDVGQDLVEARYAALGVLDATGTYLSEFITSGLTEEDRIAIGALPKGHGILGVLITDPKPLRLPEISEHVDRFGFPPNHPPMKTFLGVPLYVHGEIFGNLYFTEKIGGDPFTDIDEELATGLAAAAAIAIQNARLHNQMQELSIVADRERLGRELHDSVIQRMFATGLSMQATLRLSHEPEVQMRLSRHVDELDEVIREVRSAIFEMDAHRQPGHSVRQELLKITAESGRVLGFEPALRLDGPIDTLVTGAVADHVVAVVRESLSNVARHAHATSCEVAVAIDRSGQSVTIDITDNGSGVPDAAAAGRGLENMQSRAAEVGGSCVITAAEHGGTVVRWAAPVLQT
jgi:signal transduction histidine kinase